ncbi:hypothetical protein BMS3Abin14_00614 [bacterium BMS3Abin14]|nr:hypothetical protein BMS3Abin14_00614 [bacterium BMS3Abin14]
MEGLVIANRASSEAISGFKSFNAEGRQGHLSQVLSQRPQRKPLLFLSLGGRGLR